MTTDQPQPYSADELPGVITELWENHKRWAGSRHRDIVAMVQICGRVPRLLASFEALAEDAAYGRECRVWEDAVDNAIDAARAADRKPE